MVLVAVAIALIPVMQQAKGGEIFQYATSIQGLLGAPTCAMFILAMFWKRCNEHVIIIPKLMGLSLCISEANDHVIRSDIPQLSLPC